MKAKVAWAIEEYKKLANFDDEVGEVNYDAFRNGFAECKGKVTKAILELKLDSIALDETESKEEGGVKETRIADPEMILVNKTVVVEVKVTKKVGAGAVQKAKIGGATEQIGGVATIRSEGASVKETFTKIMTEIEAIINAVVEAIKMGSFLVGDTKS